MIERRAATALLIFIITAHVAFLLPDSEVSKAKEISRSYSVTTCPGPINDSRLTTLLPAKSVGIRVVRLLDSPNLAWEIPII
jgi:hypothetical protein